MSEKTLTGEINRIFQTELREVCPPLPGKIAFEINNSCSHKCYFCPNPTMSRSRGVMDSELLYRLMDEACRLGIKEISFYSTGEPFLNKSLPDYVSAAKRQGFGYVFLTTNGGKAVSQRLIPVLEAGLDSLKFSINAGNRDLYRQVHGVDEFDEVLANVKRVSEWRRQSGRPLRLFASFVETELNSGSFPELEEQLNPLVDEIVRIPFVVIGTPLVRRARPDAPEIGYVDVDREKGFNALRFHLPCYQLWSYLNVTFEGLLSACCSDFNNDLIVADLNRSTIKQAWHSPEFQEMRHRHIAGQIEGTLCQACVHQELVPYTAINSHLLLGAKGNNGL